MQSSTHLGPATSFAPENSFDAVIIGAGFSGLYMLHRLREQGLRARVYEVGDDVGGVWYWNRYPGAKCDVESIYYNYTFSEALLKEWTWTTRYADQPSILRYLNHVADRFELRRDIQFRTRITAAHYDEATARWVVHADNGQTVAARYLISGAGCLSSTNTPPFSGQDQFKGPQLHTGQWPHEPVDFRGKRVGVIGTGSSGIQAIPEIAKEAGHLYVFQRTPHYSTPAGNRAHAAEFLDETRERYPQIRQHMRESSNGVAKEVRRDSALKDTEDGRAARYEQAWQDGGTLLAAYGDLLTNADANATAGEFIREKIRDTVKDPAVAELLLPRYMYGCKRPVLDSGYYETFNRDNVTLVDVKSDPIEGITAAGVKTGSREYPLDMIVFATGYDAMTGALFRIDLRGRDGISLREKWQDGAAIRTYLGVATAGFPNFFMITGPESPSVLSNMVISIEQHVEWISDCIRHAEQRGCMAVEADSQAEAEWSRHCKEVADTTLLPQGESWYTGANIPGKQRSFPIYLGGVGAFRKHCDGVSARGYEGFILTPQAAKAA
ncbi:flavin-containing monooxygenase [Cupriavidus numazuensis]|uniref:Phenylacetone monooxygenase n=1 Tax=Cupriavidus numazuensis TaxID=221992 RepID=A0ABM8TLR8_9BURK|nr:NAD(P)/FAD-dependent oxidoreductase [Cupriavidus numazuensis]CAG2153837.1 Phenylacetone monooxygenase [Cupriavidus numazuensis]